jgi:hypothetical protein
MGMTDRDLGVQSGDILETVFENGEVQKEYSLKEIRQRIAQYDSF